MTPSSPHLKKWKAAFGLFFVLFILSAATYWDVLSDSSQVLGFNDGNIEANLSPVYHFPDIMVRMWENQFFFGSAGGQVPLTIGGLGESLGAEFYRRSGQAILLALCGLAFYWMCRQFQISRIPSAFSAVIMVLSGWSNTFALSGLPVRPIALAFAAISIGFSERGRIRNSWLEYAIAGGFLGLSIAESADIGAFLAITSALIFWWTHVLGRRDSEVSQQENALRTKSTVYTMWAVVSSNWTLIPKFALYVAFSAFLGWQTITSIVGTQIQGVKQGTEESPDARFAWATQWSIPPAETFDLVAGNYFGSSIRSSDSPYWGRVGQSEGWQQTKQGYRNFSMTGRHLGVIPCILFIALFIYMFRSRKTQTKNPEPKAAKIAERKTFAYPWLHPQAFSLMIFAGSSLSLMLMWGKYFPLYRLFWSLPYISTIRNPDKWLGPLSLFFCLGLAFIADILFRSLTAKETLNGPKTDETESLTPAHSGTNPLPTYLNNLALLRSSLLWAGLSIGGLALVVLLGTAGSKISFINSLIQEGYKDSAGIAYDNAINACLKVLIISGLFSALVTWVLRDENILARPQPKESKKLNRPMSPGSPNAPLIASTLISYRQLLSAGVLLAALSILDLYLDNRPYVVGHKYKHFLQPNPLTDFLDAHKSEGRIKLIPPQHPLLSNMRMTHLQIKGYDLFEPVSVSRMPVDYDTFFQSFNKDIVRLWELGSLQFFLTVPGVLDELNKLDKDRGRFVERLALGVGVVDGAYIPMDSGAPNQRYLRLVEFTGALPKYRLIGNISTVPTTPEGDLQALNRLAEMSFNPATQAILHTTNFTAKLQQPVQSSVTVLKETPVDVHLRVTTDRPCLLVRSCKFDPFWRVMINNAKTDILRINYLFQGAVVPAGTHDISLSYHPPINSLTTSIVSRLLLLLLVLFSYCEACRLTKFKPLTSPEASKSAV